MSETQKHVILTKPLPQIIDELDAAISTLDNAIKLMNKLNAEAKAAADSASKHADEAANAAREAANAAIADTKAEFNKALEGAVNELASDISGLRKDIKAIFDTIHGIGTVASKL